MAQRHSGRSRTWLGATIGIVLALSAGACGGPAPAASSPAAASGSGAPSATGAPGSSSAGPSASSAAAAPPEVLEAAGDPTLRRLSTAGQAFDEAIDSVVGVSTALGPATAAWILEQRSAAIRAGLDAAGVDVSTLPATGFSSDPVAAAGDLTALGEAYFSAVIIAPMLLDAGMNHLGQQSSSDLSPRDSTDRRRDGSLETVSNVHMVPSLTINGQTVTVEMDVTQETTTTDTTSGSVVATTSSHVAIRGRVDVCPDRDGVTSLRLEYEMSNSGTGLIGGGFSMSATSEIRATVGEDAFIASRRQVQAVTATTSGAGAAPQTGGGQRVITFTSGPLGRGLDRVIDASEEYDPGSMSAGDVARWQTLVTMTTTIASMLALEKAQDLWRSGKCVRIEATEQTRNVKANEHISFTAKPVSEVDGSDIPKKLEVRFSGVSSVTPVDVEEDPPVSLNFVAGPNERDKGTVKLKSTSNRGIGMSDITFTVVSGWRHHTSGGGATLDGEKCGGIGGQWVMDGTYEQHVAGTTTKGKEKWVVTIDEATMSGTYTYTDKATTQAAGTTVFTDGKASGDATLTLDTDGRMIMRLQDRKHSFKSRVPPHGYGEDTPTSLRLNILFWEVGADC